MIPASFAKPCTGPATIPAGDVQVGAAAKLWLEDRANLRECKARHTALAEAVAERDQVQGK